MSWTWIVRLANCDWICIIPAAQSPISEAYSFISNSSAFVCVAIFCCMSGPLMCGSSAAINHSLCYTFDIWKLTLAISVLNRSSKSHTVSAGACLISLISIIHWDSDCGFLNSEIIARRISSRVLYGCPSGTTQYFIYQSNGQPRRFIIIYTFWMSSLLTRQTFHTTSQRN